MAKVVANTTKDIHLWPYVARCSNEYAKEEEEKENATKYHGALIVTMVGDYLLNSNLAI